MASRRFPATASMADMQRWREDQRAAAERRALYAPQVPNGDGFLADAERYLEIIQTSAQYESRRRYIQEWAALFGQRLRNSITGSEVRAQRDQWLTSGPKHVQERLPNGRTAWVTKPLPLSAASVEERLRALADLYITLDGPDAPNPARAFPEIHLPRSLDGWCYVYFIQVGRCVKIGHAIDVEDRVRRLQTAHPASLHLLAAVPAHADLELAIQHRFRHLRQSGEWYAFEPELEEFIQRVRDGVNPVALLW